MTLDSSIISPSLENLVVKSRWKIIKLLGKGAFGQVYLALDLLTCQHCAMKIELPKTKKPVLKLEISVIRKVLNSPYFPNYIGCGRFVPPFKSLTKASVEDNAHSYLVMELLGPSLAELRKKSPNGTFPVKFVAIVAKQMIRSLEILHDQGFLHRDIKPANFCLGYGMDGTELDTIRCYLIDFGLSRRYVGANGRVRPERDSVGFRGTARYASIGAHVGKDLGRADDLWSFLYMILEFLCGNLPWKGKSKETIGTLKVELTNASLFSETCPHLIKIYDHLRALGYSDKPDYNYICHVFDLILEDTLSQTSIITDAKMELCSMGKTEECMSQHTPEDDEIPPLPLTSPQIEKMNQNYCTMDIKETATLFEPIDYAQIRSHRGKSDQDLPHKGMMIPRPPPAVDFSKPKPSARSNRYFLRSKK